MATNPFDRLVINPRERPLSSDINQAESVLDRSMRQLLDGLFSVRTSNTDDTARSSGPVSGFLGDGFKVDYVSASQVSLRPGTGFIVDATAQDANIDGVAGLDDLARYKPVYLSATQTISGIPAAPAAPNKRVDIIEVRMNRVLGDLSSRDVLNPSTGVFAPGSVYKSMGYALDSNVGIVSAPADSTAAISYKVGVAGLAPAVPATTSGYVRVATVYWDLASSPDGVVGDWRKYLSPYGIGKVAATIEVPSGGAPSITSLIAPPGVKVSVTTAGPSVVPTNPVGFGLLVHAGDLTYATANAFMYGFTGNEKPWFPVGVNLPEVGFDPVTLEPYFYFECEPLYGNNFPPAVSSFAPDNPGYNALYHVSADLFWR